MKTVRNRKREGVDESLERENISTRDPLTHTSASHICWILFYLSGVKRGLVPFPEVHSTAADFHR